MKAAVYHGSRDIRVEDVAKPTITEAGILVQVKACGICGSDLQPIACPNWFFLRR